MFELVSGGVVTKCSVVMPTLNEEKAIGTMIEQIRAHAVGYETESVS
jgi:hypothetical protein